MSLDSLRTGRVYEHDWSALSRIMSTNLALTVTATTTRVATMRVIRGVRCKGLDVLVLDLGEWPTPSSGSSVSLATSRQMTRLVKAARRASCTVLIGGSLEHVAALPATVQVFAAFATGNGEPARRSVRPVDITVAMNRCGGRGTARTMLRTDLMQLVSGVSPNDDSQTSSVDQST